MTELLTAAPDRAPDPGRPPSRPRPPLAANPGGVAARLDRRVATGHGDAARNRSSSSPPARPTEPWPTSAPRSSNAYGFRPAGSPTSAWPASTGCCPTSTSSPAPTSWWSSPGWKAPWPASSAGSRAAPVIAVPTSVGYGASLDGVTALLAMLASCAAGVTVVGIDNGFGAACAVARICDQRAGRA